MHRTVFAICAASLAGAAAAGTMQLGVNTHFDQGWPLAAFGEVAASHADGIRDTISWGKVEQAPGRYTFTPANSGFVDRACSGNLPVLLTLTPRNKIYDGGETIYSAQGRRAFAAFVLEIARRYPCVSAFEIGNEINAHSLKGRMVEQMPASYIAIMQAVHDAIKPVHPRIMLLSGSSLSVATGFFERLWRAGLAPIIDGVVVHPYLAVPEQLPAQLVRLSPIITKGGNAKPVWVSEFGFYYPTPEAAPPHALKMMVLLSAAGVERADWYALRDEKFYPNMGLFANGKPKPAFDSFATMRTRLLSVGNARRIETGDPLNFVYRFGATGPFVMWGSGAAISWTGPAKSWDARGTAISLPTQLTEVPVIVETQGEYRLGASPAIDDDILNFGGSSWSYAVERANGSSAPLRWIDWNWAPYIGAQAFPNIRVMGAAVSTSRPPHGLAPRLVEHYAAPDSGRYFLSACFESSPGKPQSIKILSGGQQLFAGNVDGTVRTRPLALTSPSAEIHYEALTAGGPQVLRRRIRILRASENGPALCPPNLKDVDERPVAN